MRLRTIAKKMGQRTPGYKLGGGHDRPLSQLHFSDWLDCSSSTSLALYRAKLFPGNWSLNSSGFAHWGMPGKGKWFTVWYSDRHVWIQFHGQRGWLRLDTSPWGFEAWKRGPRLRRTPRSTRGFTPRHWPGR